VTDLDFRSLIAGLKLTAQPNSSKLCVKAVEGSRLLRTDVDNLRHVACF
jgi:hypothetical protein